MCSGMNISCYLFVRVCVCTKKLCEQRDIFYAKQIKWTVDFKVDRKGLTDYLPHSPQSHMKIDIFR